MSRLSILAVAALVAVSATPVHAKKAAEPAKPAAAVPAADPQRLRAARDLIEAMQVRQMLRDMMDTMADQVRSGTTARMLAELGLDEAPKDDPHFKERMRRVTDIFMLEMTGMIKEMEPRFVEAFAMAYARQFTVVELTETATFFRTPTGQKLGRVMPGLMKDPDIIRMQTDMARTMMARMPGIVKRIEDATRDLPLPKGRDDKTEE